jgi:hypothetical protein
VGLAVAGTADGPTPQAWPGARADAVSTPACLSILRTPEGDRRSLAAIWRRVSPSLLRGDDAGLRARIAHGPAEALALGTRVGQPGAHALHDHLAFELGKGADDVEEQPAHGRGGVDGLGMADEVHAEVAELLQRRNQCAEGAREAVVLPDQHAIEAAPARVGHQSIELGRALATANITAGLVHVLAMHCEAAAFGVVPQFPHLQLWALVGSGYPGVDRHPHRTTSHDRSLHCRRTLYSRFVYSSDRPRNGPEMLGSARPKSEGFGAQPRSCQQGLHRPVWPQSGDTWEFRTMPFHSRSTRSPWCRGRRSRSELLASRGPAQVGIAVVVQPMELAASAEHVAHVLHPLP